MPRQDGDDSPGADAKPGEADVAPLLEEAISMVQRAKSMPLSSSAIVGRDELLALLESVRAGLPVELQRARRLLQDRDELLRLAERDAAELLDEARAQAARMVERTEVVRQARHHADRLVAEAEAEARRLRHEANDAVDRRLATFEIALDRTLRMVHEHRERLAATPDPDPEEDVALGLPDPSPGDGLFDQDLA